MLRRRWVRALLLLALAGAGVGYGLSLLNGPSPILQTIPVAAHPDQSYLDEQSHRLYVPSKAGGALTAIDTRQGAIVHLPGVLGQMATPPIVDNLSHHLFDMGPDGSFYMFDLRSGAVLRTIHLGGTIIDGAALVEKTDRLYVSYSQSAILSIIDGRTGDLLREVPACLASAGIALSRTSGRLFESCIDGTTDMFDAGSGRLLRTLDTTSLGPSGCGPQADVATGRMVIDGTLSPGLLDGHSGALVGTLPVPYCNGGDLELDSRTGDILIAPSFGTGGASQSAVVILDGRTGAVLHRWPVPVTPLAIQVNPLTGHLLVSSAGPLDIGGEPLHYGTLSVLDVNRGTILQRIQVGVTPGELFCDQRTRHLFVLNFNETPTHGAALTGSYPDGAWPQALRAIKGLAGWLPFKAPDPPPPPSHGTVMMLDLTKL